MKYFLVEEEGNYCGYDEEYLIKAESSEEADKIACEHADERSMEESDFDYEEDEEELHIGFTMTEISEEEFYKKEEEYGYEVL